MEAHAFVKDLHLSPRADELCATTEDAKNSQEHAVDAMFPGVRSF